MNLQVDVTNISGFIIFYFMELLDLYPVMLWCPEACASCLTLYGLCIKDLLSKYDKYPHNENKKKITII